MANSADPDQLASSYLAEYIYLFTLVPKVLTYAWKMLNSLLQIRHLFQPKRINIFLFHHRNIYCGLLLGMPYESTSSEYLLHTFMEK